eukprot:8006495-Lingulodinium_polyedra.AAC.1
MTRARLTDDALKEERQQQWQVVLRGRGCQRCHPKRGAVLAQPSVRVWRRSPGRGCRRPARAGRWRLRR